MKQKEKLELENRKEFTGSSQQMLLYGFESQGTRTKSSMGFIKMEFPPILLLTEAKRHIFYEDALPEEEIETTGYSQMPRFPFDE